MPARDSNLMHCLLLCPLTLPPLFLLMSLCVVQAKEAVAAEAAKTYADVSRDR